MAWASHSLFYTFEISGGKEGDSPALRHVFSLLFQLYLTPGSLSLHLPLGREALAARLRRKTEGHRGGRAPF
jgi:hypothetical protein